MKKTTTRKKTTKAPGQTIAVPVKTLRRTAGSLASMSASLDRLDALLRIALPT